MIWKWNHTLLALILNTALFAGCGTAVVNPVTGQAERSVMSEEAEIAEGAKAHQQVLQEYGVVSDPILQAYVNNLGQRLAKLSHRNQLQWHFTLPPTGAIRSCRPMAWVPSTWRAAPTTRAT
jgi:predicted Zn-dependent protease